MHDKVALFGATGFLGRHVTKELLQRGARIRAVSRHPPEGPAGAGSASTSLDPVALDVATASVDDLVQALGDSDVAVNLIGIKTPRGNATFDTMHVEFVQNLTMACRKAGVRRLLHVSAALSGEPPHPYHATKLRSEQIVRSCGLEWTIIRPAVVWGPGDDFIRNLDAFVRASAVVPVPARNGPIKPVWVEDVAAGIATAIAKRAAGTFDFVGPEEAPLSHWLKLVAKARGVRVAATRLPVPLFLVGAWVFENTSKDPLVTGGQVHLLAGGMTSKSDGLATLGIPARWLDEAGVLESLQAPLKRLPVRLRWREVR